MWRERERVVLLRNVGWHLILGVDERIVLFDK